MVKEKRFNPMDSFRKEQKKKEQKKAKETRDSAREFRDLMNNPSKIDQEIEKVQKQSNENKLDKGLKDRIVELQRMKEVALQKQRIDIANGRINSASIQTTNVASAAPNHSFHPPAPSAPHPYSNQGQYPPYNVHGNYPSQPYSQFPALAYYGGVVAPAIGGMNGIPLPPPRPPPAVGSVTNSQGSRTGQSLSSQRRNHQRSDGYIDPLDPTQSGYTERFNKQQQQQQQQVDFHSNQTREINAPSTLRTQLPVPFPESSMDNNSADNASDEEENEAEEKAAIEKRLAAIAATYGNQIQHSNENRQEKRGRTEYEEDEKSRKKSKTASEEESTSFVLPGMEYYDDDDDDNEDAKGVSAKSDSENNDEGVGEKWRQQVTVEDVVDDEDSVEEAISKSASNEVDVRPVPVTVDPALTAFKPTSVLRGTAGNIKKKNFTPKPPISAPPASKPAAKDSTNANALDDDYSRFMAELGELGDN